MKAKKRPQPTKRPAYRVRFIYDEDARFEECNGEARPLTEEEYAQNSYMGCSRHPRGYQGTKEHDTTAKGQPGRSVCACGRLYEPIPYEEYRAYYGNPDRHVYLGCVVEAQCGACGEWHRAESLWGIDFMNDSRELNAINIGEWMPEAEARKLPGYAGETARDLLSEADTKNRRRRS